jgi:hypothetical protein
VIGPLISLIRLHPASPVIWFVGGTLFALFGLFWLLEQIDRYRERRRARELDDASGLSSGSPFRFSDARRRGRLRIRRPGSDDR